VRAPAPIQSGVISKRKKIKIKMVLYCGLEKEQILS
jgi:hypothetical protein